MDNVLDRLEYAVWMEHRKMTYREYIGDIGDKQELPESEFYEALNGVKDAYEKGLEDGKVLWARELMLDDED